LKSGQNRRIIYRQEYQNKGGDRCRGKLVAKKPHYALNIGGARKID